MPWTVADVDRHKRGLTDAQKRQWVRIANSALASCLRRGGSQSSCDASAIRQANGVVGHSKSDVQNNVEKLIALVNTDHGEPIEDWEYLIHHIEVVNGVEELHHCFMLDHLGNKYEIDHLIDSTGKQRHVILGLIEDQDVYWSDQEAIEDGETVPCSARQLE